MAVQVLQFLQSNESARRAYLLAVEHIGRDVAQKVICVLLWLDLTMGFNVLGKVAAMGACDMSLARVVMEANAVYNYVYTELPPPVLDIPMLMTLCSGGRLVDARFFRFHKELVARGLAFIRDSFAALVFDDNLHALLRQFEDDVDTFVNPRPEPAPELTAPVVALTRTPSQDSRAAFIALPENLPLTSPQIVEYFEGRLKFGHCIDRIEMEWPGPGRVAKHGLIVFSSTQQRDQVLFRGYGAFYRVNGDDAMWMQGYLMPLSP
ncbi:hypothetical protein BS78_01G286800 [Paspalum vaginatum]|nr:hypothetical protein BS78_01G286800 [Paspalum vaginatum]